MTRRGTVVLLVGPDGSGKTTAAEAVARAGGGVRLHAWGPLRADAAASPASDRPHAQAPYGRAVSAAKLAYLFARAWAFWLARVRPARRVHSLVVVERGWPDVVVDPRRYRLSLSPRLPRALTRLAPPADSVVVLDADPAAILARKRELGEEELARQRAAWRALASNSWHVVDAAADAETVAAEVVAAVESHGGDATLALRCIGAGSPGRARYRALARGGRTRWLLPDRRGPLRAGLYRPVRARQRAAAVGLEVACALGVAGTRVAADPAAGLAPEIARALGLREVELAVATARKAGGERVVAAVRGGGRVVAYVKLGDVNRGGLARERAVLDVLAEAQTQAVRAPRVLAWLDWHGEQALVLEALAVDGPADRPLGRLEHAALAELASLASELAPVLGAAPGLVPSHGDFAPWNSARAGAALALWDWEEARLAHPLEDVFHWMTQRIVHLGAGDAASLVAAAERPDEGLLALCTALGVDPAAAPEALRTYLERGLADPRLARKQEPALPVRREALALLGSAG